MTSEETCRGGQAWSRRLRRNQLFAIEDVEGRACVSALFYNAHDPLERYNMPDTLKAQFTAFLTAGRVLYSDMGRVLCSIVADSCGWHDTVSGLGDAATARARFGEGGFQQLRNEFHRNGRDNLLVELGKHGLGKRDMVANVNFFAKVIVDEEGGLAWAPGELQSRRQRRAPVRDGHPGRVDEHAPPARSDATYAPPPVALTISDGPSARPDDPCRLSRPENGRGFALTEAYVLEMSSAAAQPGGTS